ncbi:DUF547 domain-containing protein [Subsaximicrobium wynnwilliamsii]|uniref:DUF547 domain-containing protein n=1 Tax=Subsaximicrobium wynnwilliamsii TaxID=291179 RepID=A0A5C6ZKN0_9FLAO|nr:DUF547 domain-containing protein [Subsaximicrobium wynnwilliamsii]TXD83526.1 DUF547 domain-containing protein [Subsaximicrobium wynnwilliamsii]TXD89199.1 DUF547 domain-containing protein [Subsaximicrobium wynnwilliamsii]TXE03206.1 DUF547 domain-containing protein [Subsaximicrobium wynnwilliamsii]
MKLSTLFLLLFASFQMAKAQPLNDFFTEADQFFKSHVAEGKVDYDAIAKKPSALNKLMSRADAISVSKTNANAYKAFWINAYNLAVIKGVIDNYPIKSPLDTDGFFDKITYRLAGENLTLNAIENQKLRAQFNEPRFHFVLVCGAIGCPPLIDKAYTPKNLEAQLESQTKLALNNPEFIKVEADAVQLSEIFKWYKEDFVKNGSELDFINQFRSENINPECSISYYPYNWNLNKQ